MVQKQSQKINEPLHHPMPPQQQQQEEFCTSTKLTPKPGPCQGCRAVPQAQPEGSYPRKVPGRRKQEQEGCGGWGGAARGDSSARLWDGTPPTLALGKAAPSAPSRASPPPNLLPKEPELDLPQGCPGVSLDLPLSDISSFTEIPEHKGASQDGAVASWLLSPVGTSPVRVPAGHTSSAQPHRLQGSCATIAWQLQSWGISQPQGTGSSSIFSPLCWPLSRLRQQRHPRSPPRQGWSQKQQHRLGWSREQLGQPRERGREDGGERNRHVHVFSWRGMTFPAASAKGAHSQDSRELLCSTGTSSSTMWGSNVGPGRLGFVQEEK